MWPRQPDLWGYISSLGSPKVDDVIDSNSCHMRSVRPRHDLRDLWGLKGVIMKILEVPKSTCGVWFDGRDEVSNTIYRWKTLFFWGWSHYHKFASPLAVAKRGRGSSTPAPSPRNKGGQGSSTPRAAASAISFGLLLHQPLHQALHHHVNVWVNPL
jgi:hypothetical protein